MDLCSQSCSAGQMASWPSLHGKNCNVRHYMQTFQPLFFFFYTYQACTRHHSLLPLYSTFTDLDLHFDNSLDDLDLHSRPQLYEKLKILVSIFLQTNVSIWMKFSMLPQPFGLLKLRLNVFCTSNTEGRELC